MEPENNNNRPGGDGSSTAMKVMAALTGAVAGFGLYKVLSNNTEDTEERRDSHQTQPGPSLVNSSRIYKGINQRSIWSPPPPSRFKMNTDGGCRPELEGLGGYGGILRDHNGMWVYGFRGFMGETDCFTSELQSILKGLEILDKFNLKRVILENDHESVCGFVNDQQEEYRGKSKIVRASWQVILKCRYFRDKNGITITHVGENANKCASKLADIAIERGEKFVEIKDLPYGLMDLVERDANMNG